MLPPLSRGCTSVTYSGNGLAAAPPALAGMYPNNAVGGDILTMVQYDRPEDYYDTYTLQVRSLNVAQVAQAAHDVIRPDNLVWIVVGDRVVIEERIRDLASENSS